MWKTDSRGKGGSRGPVRRPLQVSVSDDGGGSEDSEEKGQILNTFRTESRKNLLMNYTTCVSEREREFSCFSTNVASSRMPSGSSGC